MKERKKVQKEILRQKNKQKLENIFPSVDLEREMLDGRNLKKLKWLHEKEGFPEIND